MKNGNTDKKDNNHKAPLAVGGKLSLEDHIARHKVLHAMLDELVADWIWQAEGRPSGATVLELINWSHEQTLNPSNRPI